MTESRRGAAATAPCLPGTLLERLDDDSFLMDTGCVWCLYYCHPETGCVENSIV